MPVKPVKKPNQTKKPQTPLRQWFQPFFICNPLKNVEWKCGPLWIARVGIHIFLIDQSSFLRPLWYSLWIPRGLRPQVENHWIEARSSNTLSNHRQHCLPHWDPYHPFCDIQRYLLCRVRCQSWPVGTPGIPQSFPRGWKTGHSMVSCKVMDQTL